MMRTLLVVAALAAPASADPDVVTNPLQGPFASRDQACTAVLAKLGPCSTYRVVERTASRTWAGIEVSSVEEKTHTKDFGIFVRIGTQWFGEYLGTEGSVDTEIFPPCNGCHEEGCCAPSHYNKPSFYDVPKLSWVANQLVLFYPTPADGGFRETSPTAEVLQVCRLVAKAPECSEKVIALSPSNKRVKSPAELFTAGRITQP